ncbi:MAG TPA: hypothetical protein VFY17_02455 [Pilimelia sp.]|nr:hypothetical protein [Pilimelia sp.]
MRIGARFNGPDGSANGGWTAGLLAGLLDAPTARVTLRVPPPLETDLAVRAEGAGIAVYADEARVAEAVAADAVVEAVPAVDPDTAAAAARRYPGHTDHPFPRCFVCGTARPAGDGLGIFPGPVGDGRVAAPFAVGAEVTPPLVWAALDCPGGWSVIAPGRPYVLGRITTTVHALPRPGTTAVVVAHCDTTEGRKAHVRSSLYTAEGSLLGASRATWIAVAG